MAAVDMKQHEWSGTNPALTLVIAWHALSCHGQVVIYSDMQLFLPRERSQCDAEVDGHRATPRVIWSVGDQ